MRNPDDVEGLLEKYSQEQETLEATIFDIHIQGGVSLGDLYLLSKKQVNLMVTRINKVNEKKSGKSKQYL